MGRHATKPQQAIALCEVVQSLNNGVNDAQAKTTEAKRTNEEQRPKEAKTSLCRYCKGAFAPVKVHERRCPQRFNPS
jgi:hypothetical protein